MPSVKEAVRQLSYAVVVAAAVAVPLKLVAHEGHQHEAAKAAEAEAGEAITVTGEVLDLSCYLGHGSAGKEHKKCARACLVEKKVSAGLLTEDGSVYLLVQDHKHEKAFKPVGELAAEQVKVSGRKVVKGGLQGILVSQVEKVK
jgi:hypothetical protein